MSVLFVVLFSVIWAADSSVPTKTALETSRVKRDIWIEEEEGGSKYSWWCRDCSTGFAIQDLRGVNFDVCELEASFNKETYPMELCTPQQICEKYSKNNPDESPYDIWNEEYSKQQYIWYGGTTIVEGMDIRLVRACCEKFGICDFPLLKPGNSELFPKLCEIVSNLTDHWTEAQRRSCCQLGGLFCDHPVREFSEDSVKYCKEERDNCNDVSEKGLHCCSWSNQTCTIPECGENDFCLTGHSERGNCLPLVSFGGCCEFYNKCDGPLCERWY